MAWDLEIGKKAVERMQERASCRRFQNKHIPDDHLKEILETGIRAASGGNLQPYSIIVVKDKQKNQKLAELCFDQKFMGEAPINLIFLLDYYKLGRYARLHKAPFTTHNSFLPFIINLEDIVCAAQSIETAAWQKGIGSVYIGSVLEAGLEVARIFNLPKYTYPVLILTIGYPEKELSLRPRLPYELTVFEEKYPNLTDEEILDGFRTKYGDAFRKLPKDESKRKEWIETIKSALMTSYSEDETKEIIAEICENEGLNLIQYIFGLHYHAKEMLEAGREVMEQFKAQGLEPFAMLKE